MGPEPTRKPRKGNLADRAATRLKDGILRGQYPMGEPLRELELCTALGISRIPLREALHRLEGEGLVEIRPNRGAVVARLTEAEIIEIAEICRLVEGNLLVHAVPGVGREALEKAVETEIAAMLEKGVTAEEVARAKQILIDRAAFARDNLRTGAMSFGIALATGRTVADVEAWPDEIAKVTPEAVNAAARAVLKDTSSVTAVLLGTGKKDEARKATATPGSAPADGPDSDGPDVESPGAGEPN